MSKSLKKGKKVNWRSVLNNAVNQPEVRAMQESLLAAASMYSGAPPGVLKNLAALGGKALPVLGSSKAFKARNRSPKSQYSSAALSAPTAVGNVSTGKSSATNIRIKDKETIGTVTGSSGKIATFLTALINVGRPHLFKKLAAIAINYDKYRFHGLKLRYTAQCTSAQKGFVVLSFEPDVFDLAPSSYEEATESANWASSNPWISCELVVPVNDMPYKSYFVDQNAEAVYDQLNECGRLFCQVGGNDSGDMGKLEVEYDVELISRTSLKSSQSSPSSEIISAAPTAAATIATTDVVTGYQPISISAQDQLRFDKRGMYTIYVALTGTVLTNAVPSLDTALSVNNSMSLINAAGTSALMSYRYKAERSGVDLIFDFALAATTVTAAKFIIHRGSFGVNDLADPTLP